MSDQFPTVVDEMKKNRTLEQKFEIAVIHLRAAADWTDKEMENPVLAMAVVQCARNGLKELGLE